MMKMMKFVSVWISLKNLPNPVSDACACVRAHSNCLQIHMCTIAIEPHLPLDTDTDDAPTAKTPRLLDLLLQHNSTEKSAEVKASTRPPEKIIHAPNHRP